MRKLFTLVALIMAIAVSSCGYDDTSVVKSISDLLQRVSALEELQNASDVGLLIESITETSDGYIVKFTDGSEITLYHGTDGKDDANDDSTCLLKDVVITDDYVTFYLIDGNSFTFNFSSQRETVGIEFDIEDGVACMAGTSLEFGYTITGGYNDADIECWGNAGWDASIIKTNATEGKIKVISPKESKNGKVVVLVISPSGGNCMKAILFDEGIVENIVESYEAGWEANTLKVDFRTNLEYDVRIPAEAQAWLSVAETRATIRDSYIIFNIAENGEGAPIRSAVVELVNDANEVLHSFEVCQKSQPSSARIEFADQYAKEVCVGKFDINGDGEFSQKEASMVEFLDSNFFGAYNQDIKSFDELQYFINLKSILDNAFYGCNNLQSVFIPDSVTTIGDSAFRGCNKLQSITIPDGVTSIEDYVFYECSSLTSVNVPDSVTAIGEEAFFGCGSLASVNIPNIVMTIGQSAFAGCSSLASATIPNGVTSIEDCVFYECSSLTNVTIGNGVTEIGDNAFYDCTSLKEVYYTGDLLTWCKITFNNYQANPMCSGAKLYLNGVELTEAYIPSGITEIKQYAFYGCTSLTSVTIPDSVTVIGEGAFQDCESITRVYCKATTPPTAGQTAFEILAPDFKIYVSAESEETYKSADGWSDYADVIAAYDFENNVAITSGYLNGYEWVDLGLSVKWASYNVGATAPEEYGDYFAWAEISPKDEYTEHTYLYWTDHNSNGVWDDWENTMLEDIAGNPEYDAAAAIWGGGWRMPTLEEQLELRDNCTWDWILLNDTNCLQVTGPNGSSIYIPAAGYRYESGYDDVNDEGIYWSSTPADGTDYAANYLGIHWSDDGNTGYLTSHFTSDWCARIAGASIRPVLDK